MSNKKLFFVAFILLTLTACLNKPDKFNNAVAPKVMDNFSEADIIGRMTNANNSPKANLEPAEPNQQENLALEFNGAIIKTNFGNITVKFYAKESPITVNNFLNLAKAGFYNETKFHRVIKDFMIQGGDPLSKDDDPTNDGQGGPGYQFQDEFNSHGLVRGSLAMANAGPDTNGSQFFIVTKDSTPWLDGKHTNFGYVVKGMEVVEEIEKIEVNEDDRPAQDVIINSIELIKSGL